MKPGDAAAFARYVLKRAPHYNLDPNAVVAVALQEGISGKVGDNGTSFGPFQLHVGGSYPAKAPPPSNQQAANAWAWSPAGVDYALSRMQGVAGGLRGQKAVHAIVFGFERPANPQAEYQAAVKALPASDGGVKGGGIGAILGGANSVATSVVPGLGAAEGVAGAAGSVVSGTEAVASFLGKLTNPKYLLRGLEVAGGAFFILLGLYLLGRAAGVAPSVTSVAGKAAMVAAPEAAPAIEQATQQHDTHAKARRRQALDAKYGTEAPF